MKIVSIKFLNLNSLKGEHEIRFDRPPFTDSGLFAITGPTGAGKTTLLDAITIALYGNVHRHDKDDPSEIMTRHTGESYSEVEFEVKDMVYRARWANYRARKRAEGKLQGVKMELAEVETGEVIIAHPLPEVQRRIIQVCGLDYNQFVRSVMLSQGDFTRFLKANENDRSDLLEKITDTGIYSEISTWVYKEAKNRSAALTDLRARLHNVALLNEEEHNAYQASLTDSITQAKLRRKEREEAAHARLWLLRIGSLKARRQQLQQQLEAAASRYQINQPLFDKLARHRQAMKHQPLFNQTAQSRKQAGETETKLAAITSQLPALQQKLQLLYEHIEEAGALAETAKTAVQEAAPVIAEVIRKDELIERAADQYSKDRQAAEDAQLALEATEKETLENEAALKTTAQHMQALTHWLQDHIQEAELIKTIPDFNNYFGKLEELRSKAAAATKEQLQWKEQEKNGKDALIKLKNEAAGVQQQLLFLQQLQQETEEAHQAVLAGKTPDEWEAEAAGFPALISRCEQQVSLAGQIKRLEKNKAQRVAQEEANTKEITRETGLFNRLKAALLEAETLFSALQKNVELQVLIQKYETDRKALQPGRECPLCGAVHHPFIENNYTHERSKAEKARDAQKARVAELLRTVNSKELLISNLQAGKNHALEQKEQITVDLAAASQAFDQNNKLLPRPLDPGKTEVIEQVIIKKKQEYEKLLQIIQQTRTLDKQLQEQEAAKSRLWEKEWKIDGETKQTVIKLENTAASINRITDELHATLETTREVSERTAELLARYQISFDPAAGQEILQQLKERSAVFIHTQAQLHELQIRSGQVQSDVKHGYERIAEKTLFVQQLTSLLATSKKRLEQLQEERFESFGAKDPYLEKKRLEQEAQAKKTIHDNLNVELGELIREKMVVENQQNLWTKEHGIQDREYKEALALLIKELLADDIASVEVLQAQFLSKQETDNIEALLSRLEKEKTVLEGSLSDNENEVQQETIKQLTDQTIEKLNIQVADLEEAVSGFDRETGRINEILHADKKHRAQYAELAVQIDTQQKDCDRWNRLSALIGSENGKKFSRFAQGLTLARLTELANRHLLRLSDRYRIVKSNEKDRELELMIIDGYQADVVRPMTTLSGGESFLVSLALALGLSDLASRKVQINSLFIDEGFGTLDAETLDVAISALENLQANGKTIGVISHVEALKERIGTQIQLSKQPGGSSKIRIVSYNTEVRSQQR